MAELCTIYVHCQSASKKHCFANKSALFISYIAPKGHGLQQAADPTSLGEQVEVIKHKAISNQ